MQHSMNFSLDAQIMAGSPLRLFTPGELNSAYEPGHIRPCIDNFTKIENVVALGVYRTSYCKDLIIFDHEGRPVCRACKIEPSRLWTVYRGHNNFLAEQVHRSGMVDLLLIMIKGKFILYSQVDFFEISMPNKGLDRRRAMNIMEFLKEYFSGNVPSDLMEFCANFSFTRHPLIEKPLAIISLARVVLGKPLPPIDTRTQ